MKIANPQGKGQVAVLSHWPTMPQWLEVKPDEQWLPEFFYSLLVLSAVFKFKPVPGNQYYLYLKSDQLALSLIEPERSGGRFGDFVAHCLLQSDLTWQLRFNDEIKQQNQTQQFLQRFYKGFIHFMDQDIAIDKLLPYYSANLSFFPRVYAHAMAKTIRGSLIAEDRLQLPGRHWLPTLQALTQSGKLSLPKA